MTTKITCDECGHRTLTCDCMGDSIAHHYKERMRYRRVIEEALGYCHDVEHESIADVLRAGLSGGTDG